MICIQMKAKFTEISSVALNSMNCFTIANYLTIVAKLPFLIYIDLASRIAVIIKYN